MAKDRLSRRDRGATMVEYALLVALVVVACIVGLQVIEDESGDHYDETGAAVTDGGGTGGGDTGGDTGGETGGDDGTPEPTPTVSKSCPSNRSCGFSLTNAPSGVTYTWSRTFGSSPSGSGTGSSHSASLPNGSGTFTITFTWSGGSASSSVSCGNGGSPCN